MGVLEEEHAWLEMALNIAVNRMEPTSTALHCNLLSTFTVTMTVHRKTSSCVESGHFPLLGSASIKSQCS